MRGSATRIVLPALAVLALVGVVAIAATGSTPSGGAGSARLSALSSLLDVILSVSVVAFVLAAAFSLYVLTRRDEMAGKYHGRNARGFGLMYAFLFVLLAAAIARHFSHLDTQRLQTPATRPRPRPTPIGSKDHVYHPHVLWLPVLVVLALIAVGVAAALLSSRRQRGTLPAGEEDIAESLAGVLEDTLDDLRREGDPRRAVIAAYARFERVLAAYGLARRPPETPEEYVARILGALEVDRRSILRLTSLFTRAKFSQHEVDTTMKEEAIVALVRVRDELRAAAMSEGEQARPLEALGEPTK